MDDTRGDFISVPDACERFGLDVDAIYDRLLDGRMKVRLAERNGRPLIRVADARVLAAELSTRGA